MSEIYEPAEDSYLMSKTLKSTIPELLNQNLNIKFLEIGSGSGILLETVKDLGIKESHIFASDINEESVEHCKGLGFNCVYSDLFENIEGKFDIIIFNPPYLPKDSREPQDSQLITTGGETGAEITNRFLEQAENYLEENGKIFLLTSSLTKNINWRNYHKKLIGKEKIFMEELYIWELTY